MDIIHNAIIGVHIFVILCLLYMCVFAVTQGLQ